jgi:hypothetical protein
MPLILEARRMGGAKVRLTLALEAGRPSRVAIGPAELASRSMQVHTTVPRPGR